MFWSLSSPKKDGAFYQLKIHFLEQNIFSSKILKIKNAKQGSGITFLIQNRQTTEFRDFRHWFIKQELFFKQHQKHQFDLFFK